MSHWILRGSVLSLRSKTNVNGQDNDVLDWNCAVWCAGLAAVAVHGVGVRECLHQPGAMACSNSCFALSLWPQSACSTCVQPWTSTLQTGFSVCQLSQCWKHSSPGCWAHCAALCVRCQCCCACLQGSAQSRPAGAVTGDSSSNVCAQAPC